MIKNDNQRGFSSKFGFLMAAVGSAVGLGNLWSFPYKVSANGGAAFIFIYIIMALLVGIVALIGELIIGKRSQTNVMSTFTKITPKSKWLGYLAIAVPFLILCYYPVIGGWSVKYAFDYISGTGVGAIGSIASGGYGDVFMTFINDPVLPVIFLVVFIAIVTIIVLCGVKKGIEMSSKILMPLLFVCLIAVIGIGLSLPGSIEGIKYLINPDFSLVTGNTVLTALGQVFFSMSLGMGINIAYGSYMGNSMSVGSSAVLVSVMDTVMALLSSLAIFPAVFALSPDLITEGPTLLFVALAEVFGSIGVTGRVFGAIFFTLVIVAAVTSSIALLEVPVQFLVEKFNINRKVASICVALSAFSIGSFVAMSFGSESLQIANANLLDVFDTVINKMLLPITALSTCLLIGWKVKPENLMDDLGANTKNKRFMYKIWGFLIRFVTPTAIAVILVFGIYDLFAGNVKEFLSISGQFVIFFSGVTIIAMAVAANIGNHYSSKKNGINSDEISDLKIVDEEIIDVKEIINVEDIIDVQESINTKA